eukprot:TRINITY_DN1846_c0_g1_i2.p1 TRINITY_DN1846_c0_g1~~TRINITY_DN1846_c0_g1_i2.p1  ORF type:complete len:179 (-),score=58.86 TRINITY_DN1846_c0_g1_i2:82-618(-)
MSYFSIARFEANEIIEGLYLGSIHSALAVESLKQNNINYVLSLVVEENPVLPSQFEHLCIQVYDYTTQDLIVKFAICHEFIDRALASGSKVLVHCMAGISRSPTIVISYLMAKKQMSLLVASSLVRSKRIQISPNPGFRKQLLMFEQMQCNIEGSTDAHLRYREWANNIKMMDNNIYD